MVVEGQTEEEFVNSILSAHLGQFDISTDARCVETSRSWSRIFRGGLMDYRRAKKDLVLWMKEDRNADSHFTTMFDLYALPGDFPEFDIARRLTDPYRRVEALETAFARDVDHQRFVPYIQLHEFEALLLSDPSHFASRFLGRDREVQNLINLSAQLPSPELIDDRPDFAPSKRIISELPDYEGTKSSVGPLIAGKIGLALIRSKCPHFDAWISKLEQLGKPSRG